MSLFFHLKTQEITTEHGELLKVLSCPLKAQWEEMANKDNKSRLCLKCEKVVIDTALLSAEELTQLIRQQPETCLKISSNQSNIYFV